MAKYSLQTLTTSNSERRVSSNPGVINILLFWRMVVLFPQWKFYFWSCATFLAFIFYQKLDKISSSRRKTFLSQFHCSQISFKLCTSVCQTLGRTNNYSNLPMEISSLLWGIRRVRRKMQLWCLGSQIIVAHLGIETSCKGGRHFPAN